MEGPKKELLSYGSNTFITRHKLKTRNTLVKKQLPIYLVLMTFFKAHTYLDAM